MSSAFSGSIEPLPPALPGESIRLDGTVGGLNVYAAGAGPPLLLIHSINAAASAAEMRPLFEYYRQSRRVYCLELYDKLKAFAGRPGWRATVFETGALPFFEVPEQFCLEYDRFLREPGSGASG